MSTELAKTFEQQKEVAMGIDAVVANVMQNSSSAGFLKAFVKADAIDKISQYLDKNYMRPIMALAGKKIGFKMDKPDYKMEVVRECLIEATLMGVEATGNQFNIIAGNVYITKEGFTYLLSRVTGLWQNYIYDIPKVKDSKTTVEVTIQWKLNGGEKKEQILTFVIKVNAGMADDAVLGKAERKAKKWLYYEVTGNDISDGDAITVDATHEVVSSSIKVKEPVEDAEQIDETETECEGIAIEKPEGNTIEEKRAVAYLDKATDNEDLKKRIDVVSKSLPSFNLEYYVKKAQ